MTMSPSTQTEAPIPSIIWLFMLLPRSPRDRILSIVHETATTGDNGPESADAATMAAFDNASDRKQDLPSASARLLTHPDGLDSSMKGNSPTTLNTTRHSLPPLPRQTRYAQAMRMTQFLLPFVQYSVLQHNTLNRAIRRKFKLMTISNIVSSTRV